jgi:hypothetical protein
MAAAGWGVMNRKVNVDTVINSVGPSGGGMVWGVERGNKFFELVNHLGNVLATVSDRKIGVANASGVITSWTAQVLDAQDYYPFGMMMPGRKFSANIVYGGANAPQRYRYGFNSHEKSDEIAGEGNHTTAFFGEYDTRLGRRWNQDPKPNPSISNYAVFANNPIWYNDIKLDSPGVQPKTAPDLSRVTNVENVLKGKKYIPYHSEIEVPKKGFWNRLFGIKEKRSDAQCADYSRCQVGQGNEAPSANGANNRTDMYVDESRQKDLTKLDLQNGVNVIVTTLQQGQAVMVGVMYNPNKNTGNPNAATNHYVTIVGMGKDENGVYFSYYDNFSGGGGEAVGTNVTLNRFRLSVSSSGTYYFVDNDNNIPYNANKTVNIGDKDASGNPLNARYILTEVRPNTTNSKPSVVSQSIQYGRPF